MITKASCDKFDDVKYGTDDYAMACFCVCSSEICMLYTVDVYVKSSLTLRNTSLTNHWLSINCRVT